MQWFFQSLSWHFQCNPYLTNRSYHKNAQATRCDLPASSGGIQATWTSVGTFIDMPVSALCRSDDIPSEPKVVCLAFEVGTLGFWVPEGRPDDSRSSTTKLGRSVSSDVSEFWSSSAYKCLDRRPPSTRSGSEESGENLSESVSESLRFFRGGPSFLRKSSPTEYSLALELEGMLVVRTRVY
jgi:hypothetical protein